MDISQVPPGTALLVMHYQADVLDLVFGTSPADLTQRSAVIAACNAAIDHWRRMEWPVIFANFMLGADYEAVSPQNRLVSALRGTGRFRTCPVIAEIDRRPDEPLYECPRVSIFHDTSLHADLQEKGVRSIAIAGITSSGVVLSSAIFASDADYDLYIVKGASYDPDGDAHEALFRTAFATRSTIILP